MTAILVILAYIGPVYMLWHHYLAVMCLKRAREAGTLTKPAYYIGLPMLYVGIFTDFLVNMLLTIPFFDLPREWLVTGRLTRYAQGADGYRKNCALWFADNLLDPFDPSGAHIKRNKDE